MYTGHHTTVYKLMIEKLFLVLNYYISYTSCVLEITFKVYRLTKSVLPKKKIKPPQENRIY